ncbi:type II toxin -antitoxin system TacA 1-like antitoxin [Actinomadura montaniterrae]|jgi:hypothetical protein|uniref:DUF1778 domain-containing protein n=1 Tax=Actinomadura montaniterrae TaxID=1803903 RepID=A0A6L3VZC8_9ACTN|nr:DUF1778 domain-containing protein [Actinomadura montaniterrae]KAB2384792.1 DUF1778 domain-containing protein [Actinomadura montaniterrae]
MSESVRPDLPASGTDDRIALSTSAEQLLAIRKAADLIGWNVADYVLSAALDRAERDLYEHAAALRAANPGPPPDPKATEPFLALLLALS